mgnify:CR=1 FL=1
MKSIAWSLFVVTVLSAAWASGATIETIYLDPLDGGTGNLNNTSPEDRGGTGGSDWSAGQDFKQNGSIAGGSQSYGATLPFTPEPGKRYRLSADMDTGTDQEDDWNSIGFMDTNPGTTQNQVFYSNGGYGNILLRGAGNGTVFLGENTNGGTGYAAVSSGTISLMIELDTRPASSTDWLFSFFLNGTELAGGGVAQTGDPGSISYVGFSNFRDVGGQVGNFSLQIIPEPATAVFFTLGVAVFFGRRPRRR